MITLRLLLAGLLAVLSWLLGMSQPGQVLKMTSLVPS